MSISTRSRAGLAKLPPLPSPIRELIAKKDGIAHSSSLARLITQDRKTADTFLRLSRSVLPSRRIATLPDAIPHLSSILGSRLAFLAGGSTWIRHVMGESPLLQPLLRHSIAAATVAEALGRETGDLEPLIAYAIGLMHHLGDAAIIGMGPEEFGDSGASLTAQLMERANIPSRVCTVLEAYGTAQSDPQASTDACVQLLAAADCAVSGFGYASPTPCATPPAWAEALPQLDLLRRSQRRLSASIEDMMGVMVESQSPRDSSSQHSVTLRCPIVTDDYEGVSIRDLGPLPVVFSRITDAGDVDVLTSALTAALVEEFGFSRSWFLQTAADGVTLTDGSLCSRGNVSHSLSDVVVDVGRLPKLVRTALVAGRPVMLPNANDTGELHALFGDRDGTTLYVPVSVSKEVLGLLGVELAQGSDVVPDLIAAVAAHAGLALKAVHLKLLSDKAKIDELTGLFNRRGILDKLDVVLARAERTGEDLAIALIDCDHLKKVNDNFGHLMGDELVRRVSEVVNRSLRAADEVGRYGGDEFLAVLPETSFDEVVLAMERARSEVERAGLESDDGLLLSVSIGAVVRGDLMATRDEFLKMADNALYRSKESGRNSVTVVRAEPPTRA